MHGACAADEGNRLTGPGLSVALTEAQRPGADELGVAVRRALRRLGLLDLTAVRQWDTLLLRRLGLLALVGLASDQRSGIARKL